MRANVIIQIPAGALREMTTEQFKSLQAITTEGCWENVTGPVPVSGTDYLGVYLPDIFLGIEKDGYCHS